MEVFKTLATFDDAEEGFVIAMDTIHFRGQWWLVRSWLVANATGERVPEKLIRPTMDAFRETGMRTPRFELNTAIPKTVLDGNAAPGFEVAYYPVLD